MNELYAQLIGQAEEIMYTTIADKAVKIQKNTIDDIVYGAYGDPREYERRKGSKGGLRWGASAKSIRASHEHEALLTVFNKAEPNMSSEEYTFKNLPLLIEYGHRSSGYFYDFTYNREHTAYKYKNPRPFMQKTYEKLSAGVVEETLAKELRKIGYVVRIKG